MRPSIGYRQQGHKSEGTAYVVVRLTRYKKLRKEEEELREKVDALEEQIALSGLRKADIDSKIRLEKEKAKLINIRHELDALNEQLQRQNNISLGIKKEIDADSLAKLMSEIKTKRALALQHHKNILFLEEKDVLDGGYDTELDLINELEKTRDKLKEIQAQLLKIENEVHSKWGVNLRELDFRLMDEKKIEELAYNIVEKKYDYDIEPIAYTKEADDTVIAGNFGEQKNTVRPESNNQEKIKQQTPIDQKKVAETKTLTREVYTRFSKRITKVLEEYKETVYPTHDIGYSELDSNWAVYQKNNDGNVDFKICVSVVVSSEPICFRCVIGNNTKLSEDLTRRSLIKTLVELHLIENQNNGGNSRLRSPLPRGWM